MIRILILTDTNVLAGGGAEQHVKTVLERLDYAQFHVHVIQLQVWGEVPSREGRIAGATYTHWPTGRLWTPRGLSRLRAIRRHILTEGYDCVLSFFETSDLISWLVAGPSSGVVSRISSRRDTGFRYSSALRLLYGRINGCFSTIIAASNAVRDALMETGVDGTLVRVVYNGVDLSRFEVAPHSPVRRELAIPEGAVVMGMVANLTPVKDHETVLRAAAILHSLDKPVHLILAGEGELEETLRSLASDLRLGSFVHFLGRRTDVPEVLNATDIFVLASRTEGLSNALLEAMAAGKPVVATRVGGNPEVVVHESTGLLIPPAKAPRLAEAIGRLYSDRPLREGMGLAARQRVAEAFSVDRMVSDYADTILASQKTTDPQSLRSPSARIHTE